MRCKACNKIITTHRRGCIDSQTYCTVCIQYSKDTTPIVNYIFEEECFLPEPLVNPKFAKGSNDGNN